MFVVYTIMAVVHMIYTMMKPHWGILYCIIQQKPVTMYSTHCISLPSDSTGQRFEATVGNHVRSRER